MFTTAVKNSMLDAISVDAISAHNAFPGGTGANEMAGGGYARPAVTFAAAAAGIRSLSTATSMWCPHFARTGAWTRSAPRSKTA